MCLWKFDQYIELFLAISLANIFVKNFVNFLEFVYFMRGKGFNYLDALYKVALLYCFSM